MDLEPGMLYPTPEILSVRDMFAMAALRGVLAGDRAAECNLTPNRIMNRVEFCYQHADAMLEAKRKYEEKHV